MSVTKAEVQKIARLSALAVDEKTLEALTRQIGGILEYVSQLESVPGAPDEAGAGYPGARQPLRDDTPRRTPLAVPLKEIAPSFQDGLFLVPRLEALGPGNESPEEAE